MLKSVKSAINLGIYASLGYSLFFDKNSLKFYLRRRFVKIQVYFCMCLNLTKFTSFSAKVSYVKVIKRFHGSKPSGVSTKVFTPGLRPKSPISSGSSGSSVQGANNRVLCSKTAEIITPKAFFQHGTKTTISPYTVEPIPYDGILKTSILPLFAQNYGFNLFAMTQTSFATFCQSLPVENKISQVVSSTPLVNSSEKARIVSVSVLPPSEHMPNMDPGLYGKSILVNTYVWCRKLGMSTESAMLSGAFLFGNPGQNIQVLEAISKTPGLNKILNMLEYLPKDAENHLSVGIIKQLSKLKPQMFTKFYESAVCVMLNESLVEPFRINESDVNSDNSIQNLTGQKRPDFIRKLTSPINTIVQEVYDQKSSVLPVRPLNHVRPVPDNLASMVLEAQKEVYESIVLWQRRPENADNIIVQKLLNQLDAVKETYTQSLDAQTFALNYNRIRDIYAAFFVEHRIPMNLVLQTGIQHFPVNADDLEFFKATFLELYHSVTNPVIRFHREYLEKNNGVLGDPTAFLQKFAKHLHQSDSFN